MDILKSLFSNKNTSKLFPIIEDRLFPEHVQYIRESIKSFKTCKTFEAGFAKVQCPTCLHLHKIPFACKFRFCPVCGKNYAALWAESINKQLLNVSHRIGFFSIAESIRCYFFKNRSLLTLVCNEINSIFKKIFSKHKIKYFGLILSIHTFGRDINFNPHIHFILTEGGFTEDFQWKKLSYFHYELLRKAWQKLVLDTLQKHFPNDDKFKKRKNECYNSKENKGFFIAMEKKLNNSLTALKYIARYLARPAITEYRIISHNDNEVSFWYEHVETKERKEVTLPTTKFLGRLVSHIPPKNFKMIRRFGIYARRKKSELKKAIKLKKNHRLYSLKRLNYRDYIIKVMGIDILECPVCGDEMKLTHIKWKGKEYSFKT